MSEQPKIPQRKRIILDLCGGTGAWSRPYIEAGYDVRNVTLPRYDIRIFTPPENVYGILAAPPCPQFSFGKTTGKPRDLRAGMEIVFTCLKIIWEVQYCLKGPYANTTNLKFWALENPGGLLKHFLGEPVFMFNPYDFGDNYRKKTHLWGYFNIPKKNPIKCTAPKFDRLKTKEIHGEYYGKYDRLTRRAITPSGFAKAFFKANR